MSEGFYVILIDKYPYRKDRAVRTYMTRERAEKEARKLAKYWSYRDSKFETAKLASHDVRDVEGVVYVEHVAQPPMPREEDAE